MKRTQWLTGIIEREGDGFVSRCRELNIASQGQTIEEARHNLIEAVDLFFETASASEIRARLRGGPHRISVRAKGARRAPPKPGRVGVSTRAMRRSAGVPVKAEVYWTPIEVTCG